MCIVGNVCYWYLNPIDFISCRIEESTFVECKMSFLILNRVYSKNQNRYCNISKFH